MKNKIIIVCLSVIMLLSLVSCTKPITDDEARAILEELIPKAEIINDIVWGVGLDIEPGQDEALNTVTAAQYRTVAKNSPYQSTEELKAAIAEVYSDAFIANTIEYACFTGADDALENTEAQMYPRYADGNDGVLVVDITNKGFELTTKIDPASAKVVSAKRGKQNIEVKATVGGEETTLIIVLVQQESGWRLDTPTY
ncbi:MAG: hypothetical protein IJA55_07805 [Clostridia bacterium]|nr:hypothetical protein [Clostridia bacterium]